jgi:glucosamine--fructose-6-phosphate aminotransferase (isomerizing)
MCGIIAVVRRAPTRPVPTSAAIRTLLASVTDAFSIDSVTTSGLDALVDAVDKLERANAALLGLSGLQCLRADAALVTALLAETAKITAALTAFEQALDHAPVADIEQVNALLIRAKDACWSIERDRIRTAGAVTDLARIATSDAGLGVYLSTQQALSALDRLEVRGRDSAGLHLLVFDHGLDMAAPAVVAELARRGSDSLFQNRAVRHGDGWLSFVYKAAAEIGELGDNTRALRSASAMRFFSSRTSCSLRSRSRRSASSTARTFASSSSRLRRSSASMARRAASSAARLLSASSSCR